MPAANTTFTSEYRFLFKVSCLPLFWVELSYRIQIAAQTHVFPASLTPVHGGVGGAVNENSELIRSEFLLFPGI